MAVLGFGVVGRQVVGVVEGRQRGGRVAGRGRGGVLGPPGGGAAGVWGLRGAIARRSAIVGRGHRLRRFSVQTGKPVSCGGAPGNSRTRVL